MTTTELIRHADEIQANDPGMGNTLRQVAKRGGDAGEAWDCAYALSLASDFTGVDANDIWRIRRYIRYITLFG